MSASIVPTADGSLTLRCHRYRQTFHSLHGAKTEALHVYLEGGAVSQILAANQQVRILEVGFGAGLNFLLTAALARRIGGHLLYTALDERVLDAKTLEALDYGEMSSMPDIWNALLRWRKTLSSDIQHGRYVLTPRAECKLELILGDASTATLPRELYDVIYLDAFDPKCNPALWTEAFLARLYDCCRPGGRLVTYSVAGAVRRGLTKAGFRLERRPGPPGKRHCLAALKPSGASALG